MRCKLELRFCGTDNPGLYESHFTHPLTQRTLSTVRGKISGAFINYGSFQWSKAVRALCIIALKAKCAAVSEAEPILIKGEAGSMAASLDYAIQKEPGWLLDMFGVDSNGRSLVRRLLHRSNPGRKRPGPVALAWNCAFLAPENIEIEWEGERICDPRILLHSLMELPAEYETETRLAA